MNKVPNSFSLSKVKLLKDGGISIKHSAASTDGSVTNIDQHTLDSPKEPHPDLKSLLEGMKGYLADTHNIMPHKALKKLASTAKVKASIEDLSAVFKDIENETLKNIEVTGVAISGTQEKRNLVITGKIHHNKETIGISSPLIKLDGEKWGWEFELDEQVEDLIVEVKAFLFEGKAAQLEMEFDSPAAEKEEEAEKKTA